MAHAVPDFEDQFGDESFSDVEVVICEEGTDLGKKRKREQSIPGHSMVLMGFSSYCKAKLKNWSARDDTVSTPNTRSKKPGHTGTFQHTVELIVPAGQTDVAVRLVKGMYQRQPDLSDLSQEQQLQLLLLADRFGVPKLQAAAAGALKSLPVDELHWDTAVALLQLPDSFAQQEDCKQLCEPAVRKLLQQLGDLEQVWADEQLQQLLTGLPHAALLRLLQHDDTRVASEATIVYTIRQWSRRQPDVPSQDAEVRALLQQVRMQHLSLEYISSNLMRSDWVVPDCYTASELGIACLLASATSCSTVKSAAPAEFTRYPAWTAAKRPISAVQQEITWSLPLSDLRALLDEQLHTKEEASAFSKVQVLQGRKVRLKLEATSLPIRGTSTTGGDSARPVALGLYLCVDGLPPGSVYVVAHVSLESSGTVGTASHKTCNFRNRASVAGESWGSPRLIRLGCINDAADGEAALKEQKLVHADGCLHLAAKDIKLL